MSLSIFQLYFLIDWGNEPQKTKKSNNIKLWIQQVIKTRRNNEVLPSLLIIAEY